MLFCASTILRLCLTVFCERSHAPLHFVMIHSCCERPTAEMHLKTLLKGKMQAWHKHSSAQRTAAAIQSATRCQSLRATASNTQFLSSLHIWLLSSGLDACHRSRNACTAAPWKHVAKYVALSCVQHQQHRIPPTAAAPKSTRGSAALHAARCWSCAACQSNEPTANCNSDFRPPPQRHAPGHPAA